jgi:diacylglycerol kinase (ATP)
VTIARRPAVTVVINPAAGRGAAIGLGERAARALALGADVTVLRPSGGAAGSLDALRAAARAVPDAVVVCGGDGIVHLAANVLAGGHVPLAVIPAGSGNDTATALGMSGDAERAAAQVLAALTAGSFRRIDVGRCDGPELLAGTPRAFVGLVYAGFDSIVNDLANRLRWPRGAARYNFALAIETARLRARTFEIAEAGRLWRVPATLIAVGNGSHYGGGKWIAPHAHWDDGLLGMTVIGPVSRWTLARLAPTLPHAGHATHPRVLLRSVREVIVDAPHDRGVVAYADGERVGPLPLRVWTEPAGLLVVAPAAPHPRP